MITLKDLIEYDPSLVDFAKINYEVDEVSGEEIKSDEFNDDFTGRYGKAFIDRERNRVVMFKVKSQEGRTLKINKDLTGAKTVNLMPSWKAEIKGGENRAKEKLSDSKADKIKSGATLFTLYLIYKGLEDEGKRAKAWVYLEAFRSIVERVEKEKKQTMEIKVHGPNGRI